MNKEPNPEDFKTVKEYMDEVMTCYTKSLGYHLLEANDLLHKIKTPYDHKSHYCFLCDNPRMKK